MCYIEKFQYNNILAWKLKYSYKIYIYIYTKKDDHKSNTLSLVGLNFSLISGSPTNRNLIF